ncbi:hypothetical protein DIPPA_03361 [Diplonema papillatum]|nr:hypothetical protein DIPPA_03361 [Diplonema papillatum]
MSDPEWHVNHCGPTFQVSESTQDVQHPFVVYTAEINPKDAFYLDIGAEEVRYMFWGHVRKSVNCRQRTVDKCNDALCRWNVDDGVCLPSICPPPAPYTGPQVPICQVCIGDAGPQEQLPAVDPIP